MYSWSDAERKGATEMWWECNECGGRLHRGSRPVVAPNAERRAPSSCWPNPARRWRGTRTATAFKRRGFAPAWNDPTSSPEHEARVADRAAMDQAADGNRASVDADLQKILDIIAL